MTDDTDFPATSGFNRRAFIAGAAGTAVAPLVAKAAGPVASTSPVHDPSLPVNVTLRVNGDSKSLQIDARTTVLDALREHIGLTGAKKGCDRSMRRLHSTDRRPAGGILPHAGARCRGPANPHHRRPGERGRA